jgi:hypothetical protein
VTVETFVPRTFAPGSLELIDRARNVLDQYARQGYDLSLRQLYYQFVSRGWLDNNDRNYKRLGSVINDARLAGLIDWKMIKDRGRTTTTVPHWTDPAQIVDAAARSFRIDKWQNQPVHVEAMVEKQALEGVLVPVCREVDIAFSANKGYSSASAMYEAGKRMKAAMDAGKRVVVLYLGDHDPSGIDMSRDVRERLEMFTGYRWYDSDDATWYRDPTYDGDQITVNRLALNMEQVEEYNPPPNPAKATDSRVSGYLERFGDTSWELDALEPTVLASLVRDAAVELRDEDLWDEAVARETAMRDELFSFAATYHSNGAS